MSAIVVALSSVVLTRLKLTWAHVGRQQSLNGLTNLLNPSNNFSSYRSVLKEVEGPCVPFIGCFLSDLVHTNDRYKDIAYYPLVGTSDPSSSSSPPDRFDQPMQSSMSQTFPSNAQSLPNVATPRSLPSLSSHWPQTASSVQSTFALKGPPLINMVKRRKWYETGQSILRFQGKAPVVQENAILHAFVVEQIANASAKARDPEGFWDRSYEVQQSELSQGMT